MSARRACDDDEIKSFRHDLEALAAETRSLAAPEGFADALARRLREWHLTPTEVGEKRAAKKQDRDDQSAKLQRL